MKNPYKSERSRLPRLGELSAEQTEGSYLGRQAHMRLIDEKVLGTNDSNGKSEPPEKASPKFGEVAPKATEGLYYLTNRK